MILTVINKWYMPYVLLYFLVHSVQLARAIHDKQNDTCSERKKFIYPCTCSKSDKLFNVHCEKTNLATLSVALHNAAASESLIDHLTIKAGNFETIYGPLFWKTKIRVLTILETHFKTIENFTFFGVNRTLEKVHIVDSNLISLSPNAFGILGKLSELLIDGHHLETLDKNLFLDQVIANHIDVLRIANGLLSDLPIESFQPLRKLKHLDLHGNQFGILKRNQFKNLRELESLDLSHNKITKLEAQHISDLTKLGWLNMSHNALKELTRGTFARNAVLKVLNLSHNNISRLDANSFRGMRFLRRLYLSDNRLNEIGKGTFTSLTRIGTIDLTRNFLKKIHFQMFAELNYIEIIGLAENNISLIEKQSFKNIYQASINISHNAIEKIEPDAFINCVNITVLDLSFNRIKNLSQATFDATTFATELQLAHNNFYNISQIPLQYMTGLKVFNVSYNKIQDIPRNFFPKLYELHTVDLAHNNITRIANGVFQTLFSLRVLDVSYNGLKEIRAAMFGTLPTLLELDLSHNNLTVISRGAFVKLSSMRFLRLSNNKLDKIFEIPSSLNELFLRDNNINSIRADTWPVMNSLLLLDLGANRIGDALEEESFRGLSVLQKLVLNNNGITEPPYRSLTGITALRYLYLEMNNITKLNKNAFGKLPVLFELDLYKNNVSIISKNAFEGLLQLLTLNLSANAISSLPLETFVGLPSLRNLDLSHNFLTKLDNKTNGVLDDLLSLENLNLSYNRISFVTKKTFPSNQYIPYNLKYLDLSHNQMPVLTYDITFGTKKLKKLNLSHNGINEIRKGVLGNLSSLENLDLSNNKLSDLSSEGNVFDFAPPHLSELYINNNQIYRISFETFLKEQKMDMIDLRNNFINEFPLSLLRKIKNGTKVDFSGNPLICNCAARPYKHYIKSAGYSDDTPLNITCTFPNEEISRRLNDIEDEHLECSKKDKDTYRGEIYDILSDIAFRDIAIKNDNVEVSWFVKSNEDIADFEIYVRSKENSVLFQKEYLYNAREALIPIGGNTNFSDIFDTEICIISRDSNGRVRRWFKSQCRKVPQTTTRRNWFSTGNSLSPVFTNYFNTLLVIFAFIKLFQL